MTTTRITVKARRGILVAGSTAAVIEQALAGAQPLTITEGPAAGDTVWLAPRHSTTLVNDAVRSLTEDIAWTTEDAVYAYIDEYRLSAAPALAGLADATPAPAYREPSCGHCGDCGQCC